MLKKVKLCFIVTSLLASFEVSTKIDKYLYLITEEDITDCSNIKEYYDMAMLYLNAKNKYSSSYTAVGALQCVYNKCKDKQETDRATFAKVIYELAKASFSGIGINRDFNKAYEYIHELYDNYKDILEEDNDFINNVRSYLGDELYWGFAADKNWTKAMNYYLRILADFKETSPVVVAWAQARIADAYREGKCFEQDDTLSLEWFQIIVDNDENITDKSVVGWAKYWIAYAYEHGKGVEQDLDKALSMFTDIAQTYTPHDPSVMQFAQFRIDAINEKINSVQ